MQCVSFAVPLLGVPGSSHCIYATRRPVQVMSFRRRDAPVRTDEGQGCAGILHASASSKVSSIVARCLLQGIEDIDESDTSGPPRVRFENLPAPGRGRSLPAADNLLLRGARTPPICPSIGASVLILLLRPRWLALLAKHGKILDLNRGGLLRRLMDRWKIRMSVSWLPCRMTQWNPVIWACCERLSASIIVEFMA
jgi:hypothetical protein